MSWKILFSLIGILFFSCAAQAEADPLVHQVRSGETLWSISRQYSVPVKEIVRLNHLRNPKRLDVGQKLLIPVRGEETPRSLDRPYQPRRGDLAPDQFDDLNALCRASTANIFNWKYIVIHHSATPNGGARAFDHYHRAKRHMQNGLAYHFVIGNGNGAGDGEIEVGPRWKKQVRGGHCSNQKMNDIGIGICLVGNFEKSVPTRRQMASLVALVKYLQNLCDIPNSHIILHKEVRQKSTLCPGGRFPAAQFRRLIGRS